MIKIPKHVEDLQPYKAGKPIEDLAREKGIKKIVKLASNENPLGPSPKALEAIRSASFQLHRYSNPSAYKLVNVLSEKTGKKPGQIITGSGSDSLLQYAVTAFSDDQDEMITSQGTFIGWYVNVNKYGRKSVLVPLKNYTFDLKGIADAVTPATKIIYLANPNNPTGTIFKKNEFEKFLKRIPENILIILDEAYTIYAESDPDYPNGLDYELPNLIVMRTLSKAYGLAGIRIGFAAGPENLISYLYKVKLPFEPNSLAQEAAIAALSDDDFISRTVELNKLSLGKMSQRFNQLGIKYVPTHANFFLLLFPSASFASAFNEECLNYGLILRLLSSFGIDNGIRINSGTVEETSFALDVIEKVYTSLIKKKSRSETTVI
jgi:histidinol-phosphate aminotransferase